MLREINRDNVAQLKGKWRTHQEGAGLGASLATIARDPQALANTAWNGKNTMPLFRGTLTPEQLRDVTRYISDELFSPHPL